MHRAELARAVAAATSIAVALGLEVDDAVVVNNSNKLTLRLLPGDVLARVAPAADQVARFEIEIAQRLAEFGSPVAALDPRVEPRVHERDGFVVTLWNFYESATPPEVSAIDYADALGRLHAGLRRVDVPAPHFTDRVDEARRLVAGRALTPALSDPDREFLGTALQRLRRTISEHGDTEQLLHGEPHPGNLLSTRDGPLFIDFETCCRGPVEFDLAHAPEDAGEHYPGVDPDLLRDCRMLVLAMITAWRWDRDDQFPNGRQLGIGWLDQLRSALNGPPFNR